LNNAAVNNKFAKYYPTFRNLMQRRPKPARNSPLVFKMGPCCFSKNTENADEDWRRVE
jgi:hypothetical protein